MNLHWHGSACTRRGFAARDVVVVAVVAVLCGAILILTVSRRRELVRQKVCSSNLMAIGAALYSYAADNRIAFPVAVHAPAVDDLKGNVEYVRAIGSYRGRSDDPQAGDTSRLPQPPQTLSTTRNLWTLIRLGLITADRLVCPGTKDTPNTDTRPGAYWDFGVGDIEGPATPEQSRAGYAQVSYGYQIPYGKYGQPDKWHDKSPIVADKGPFGATLEAGTPAPPAQFPTSNDPAQYRPFNSPNHVGEGQVVMYADGHAQFVTSPNTGWASDNIYTQRYPPPPPSGISLGAPPAPGAKLTPAPMLPQHAHYVADSLIYP